MSPRRRSKCARFARVRKHMRLQKAFNIVLDKMCMKIILNSEYRAKSSQRTEITGKITTTFVDREKMALIFGVKP